MTKLDTTALPGTNHLETVHVSERSARAAKLVVEHDLIQKKIIDFIQEDPQVKTQGWQGSPYSYLQYVLAQWAVNRLK